MLCAKAMAAIGIRLQRLRWELRWRWSPVLAWDQLPAFARAGRSCRLRIPGDTPSRDAPPLVAVFAVVGRSSSTILTLAPATRPLCGQHQTTTPPLELCLVHGRVQLRRLATFQRPQTVRQFARRDGTGKHGSPAARDDLTPSSPTGPLPARARRCVAAAQLRLAAAARARGPSISPGWMHEVPAQALVSRHRAPACGPAGLCDALGSCSALRCGLIRATLPRRRARSAAAPPCFPASPSPGSGRAGRRASQDARYGLPLIIVATAAWQFLSLHGAVPRGNSTSDLDWLSSTRLTSDARDRQA